MKFEMSKEITNVTLDQDTKEWAEKSEKEIKQLKAKQCCKCYYYSKGQGDSYGTSGTCDYILIAGKMRGCNPFDCVKKGIFTPKKRRRRKKAIRI